MNPIDFHGIKKIARVLTHYAPRATTARLAGLLTVPEFHSNSIRLEVLVHLAVAYCAGNIKPDHTKISRWLNENLGRSELVNLEDPAEDIFVGNVYTSHGNYRVFQGIWESPDYFLQVVLDILESRKAPPGLHTLTQRATALLQLSDVLAERLGLQRWDSEQSSPSGKVLVVPLTRIEERARAVTFTQKDLKEHGISPESLLPFIFTERDQEMLKISPLPGHSSLKLHPIINFGDALVLALPSAISIAIRRYVLSELQKYGYLHAFSEKLAVRQLGQVQEALWEMREGEVLRPTLTNEGPLPSMDSFLLKYDVNKYLHVVLLHEQLEELLKGNRFTDFPTRYPEPVRAGLERYFEQISVYCEQQKDFTEGTTLLVIGGLGGGFTFEFKNWPKDGWRFSSISIPDLLMLAGDVEQPITRYLKCIKQKDWAERKGISFVNLNGDFNFYCYWLNFKFQLIPRELEVGPETMIGISSDFVLNIREKLRRLNDYHVAQTLSGPFVRVMRFGRDSYFQSSQKRPIYVNLDHLGTGILAAIVETKRGSTWFVADPRDCNVQIRKICYDVWSGFLGLFHSLLNECERLLFPLIENLIEIRLNFRSLTIPEEYTGNGSAFIKPFVAFHHEEKIAEITFPSDFLCCFQQHENKGEKLVMEAVVRSVLGLLHPVTPENNTDQETLIQMLLQKTIGDEGIRVLHITSTYLPIEYLLAQSGPRPTFIAYEDFVFAKLTLWDHVPGEKIKQQLKLKTESIEFLNNKVAIKVWEQIRTQLQQFDRKALIQKLIGVHEGIIRDRNHWNQTAKAIISLNGAMEDVYAVARERERRRVEAAVAARTIIEMGICECPIGSGRELSQWELDILLAKAMLLIEVATDSDAIHTGLIEPLIELHSNGEYTVDRSFNETVIAPFVNNYHREVFEDAANDYSKLYQVKRPAAKTRADEIYSAAFVEAFQAEFGLTPDEALDGFIELMEIAVEQDSTVVQTTAGSLRKCLIERCGLSHEATKSFLKTFGLISRPSWDIPPDGFCTTDIVPWRFRRRLSAVSRPLLILGPNDNDIIFYGAGTAQLAFGYLLGRTEEGKLPQRFFTTKVMKKYIGSVNDERGHGFAENIAEKLREQGWEARNEVTTGELGAPKEAADGDIDVLAWKQNGQILLIECKRLQLARTVTEIAEICSRFRGDVKDELGKHVRRVQWVIGNPKALQKVVGFVPNPGDIEDRLVTNTHVPMKYLASLPIPADKIGPL